MTTADMLHLFAQGAALVVLLRLVWLLGWLAADWWNL
jgi:hypothetical protein